MAKLVILTLCLLAAMQLTVAKDLAEALNQHVRDQLRSYQQFLAADDGSHKDDLTKLIQLSEKALKTETLEEKQTILNGLDKEFSPEFNKYISALLEEDQVNDDIDQAIEFYKSLIAGESAFKTEIDATIVKLTEIRKVADLKDKEAQFLSVDKSFTPEFMAFLKDNALPNVNRELQRMVEFFDNLLAESDAKYTTEIQELKKQAEAAVGDNLSVDDKQSILQKVTNPSDRELYEYLQKRFVELS